MHESRRLPLMVGAGFLLVLGGAWIATWIQVGDPVAWFRPADDAYYYYQVAENVAQGHGPTMDRINATNGFHPLWLVLLVPVFGLVEEPTTQGIVLTQLLILLLLAASAALLYRLSSRRFSTWTGLLSAIALAFPEYRNVAMAGVEGAVALPLYLLVAREMILRPRRMYGPPTRGDGWFGLLLALVMLARLDGVFLLLVVAAWILLAHLREAGDGLLRGARKAWSKGLAVYWPVLVLVVPYLVWNEWRFGHVVPISGVLKSTFPEPNVTWSYIGRHWEYLVLLAVATAGWTAARLRGPRRDAYRTALGILTVASFLHLAYTLGFMRGVFWWHYVSFVPTGLLGIGYWAEPVLRRVAVPLRRTAVAAAVLLMVASIVISATRRLPSGELAIASGTRLATLEAAEWVRRHLPEEAVLGMKDSGAFTFHSRRRVVNMDGMINNLEYQERKCSGELHEYLHEVGVQYIVQHRVPLDEIRGEYDGFVQGYPCLLEEGHDATLTFSRDDEVFRGRPYWSGSLYGPVVIWRLSSTRAVRMRQVPALLSAHTGWNTPSPPTARPA